MMLNLKLQYFVHLMQRVDSLDKTLMLGGIGSRRKRWWQRMRWQDGIPDSMDIGLNELREMVMDREAWRAVIHGVTKSRTWLSNWTELNFIGYWLTGLFQLFGGGAEIFRNWTTTHFLVFDSLATVMVLLGVSFSLLMCYNEGILKIKVYSKLTSLPSWTHLILISLCCALGLCYSFKGCALPLLSCFKV